MTLRPASTAGHDAVADDGRAVEIKATYGTGGVGCVPALRSSRSSRRHSLGSASRRRARGRVQRIAFTGRARCWRSSSPSGTESTASARYHCARQRAGSAATRPSPEGAAHVATDAPHRLAPDADNARPTGGGNECRDAFWGHDRAPRFRVRADVLASSGVLLREPPADMRIGLSTAIRELLR